VAGTGWPLEAILPRELKLAILLSNDYDDDDKN
jgi:hypothetical protein